MREIYCSDCVLYDVCDIDDCYFEDEEECDEFYE